MATINQEYIVDNYRCVSVSRFGVKQTEICSLLRREHASTRFGSTEEFIAFSRLPEAEQFIGRKFHIWGDKKQTKKAQSQPANGRTEGHVIRDPNRPTWTYEILFAPSDRNGALLMSDIYRGELIFCISK